ncbi:hypothetical protein CONPUDRAFT_137212 [Coniophora puteana RWD-64-598 SS2]|uniref:TECPR1-like DysF domain-containing protein n=1 Tax=Coniophora puteana (strain RWD-64-598) TaxID=741705 RepID=A0A5M3MPZ3_CONPW|nr:uncharacterized protein CONPUDRAFT_137212 [Coniophora puteana RWD-64-598 SS2]EIW81127.1 hypothetical protein CONPUDRAFT_137212 [Coniophora puteana RWD-64-598 SS2]
MATFDYVDFPKDALRLSLASVKETHNLRPAAKVHTSLPHSVPDQLSTASPISPTAKSFGPLSLFPQLLLSSALPPSTPGHGRSASQGGQGQGAGSALTSTNPRGQPHTLLSTRDPLSIPITTVNFRRFVGKIGPLFWLQDRIEEIVAWKRGWKVTSVWIAAYGFLCYFPRLVLLLPHAIVLGVILANHPEETNATSPPVNASEGSVDWQANLQAIQNLMGAYSDAYDAAFPLVTQLTTATSSSRSRPQSPLLPVVVVTLLLMLPILPYVPLRPLFFILGVAPLIATHPFVQSRGLALVLSWKQQTPFREKASLIWKRLRGGWKRAVDDDRLLDKHWGSEMREVELWENERLASAPVPGSSSSSSVPASEGGDLSGSGAVTSGGLSSWAKVNLRHGERSAWTRGRDGWKGVANGSGEGEVSSNLTFSLAPGWAFVETEGWRADLDASWCDCGGDDDGWVYTNDAWLEPREAPANMPSPAVTRRRRWTRRIYWDPERVN